VTSTLNMTTKTHRSRKEIKLKALKSIATRIEKEPVYVSGILFFTIFTALFSLDYYVYKFSPYLTKNIIVEAHGLMFDVFIFGIIILYIDRWRAKKIQITRYMEELEDYKE
jgi:hypothetical protein